MKFEVKKWLLFTLGLFVALWLGDYAVNVFSIADGMTAFLVKLGVAGAVGYYLWERWLRRFEA